MSKDSFTVKLQISDPILLRVVEEYFLEHRDMECLFRLHVMKYADAVESDPVSDGDHKDAILEVLQGSSPMIDGTGDRGPSSVDAQLPAVRPCGDPIGVITVYLAEMERIRRVKESERRLAIRVAGGRPDAE